MCVNRPFWCQNDTEFRNRWQDLLNFENLEFPIDALTLAPVFHAALFLVVLCGVEHGVEDCGELPCAGCDGDLCGVCGVLQAFSECREGRVIAACDEGGEVKGAADVGVTAPEVALAALEARCAGVGCQAREACDAPVVQLAKLRQAGDQDGDLAGRL